MSDEFKQISELMKSKEAYEIYKFCMYMPTMEKYMEKVNQYICNENIKMYACFQNEQMVGIIVICLLGDTEAEIIGISVDEAYRSIGVGAYMIRMIKEEYSLTKLIAETDDDAIEFYRKCGFRAEEQVRNYGGKQVVRYHCELT